MSEGKKWLGHPVAQWLQLWEQRKACAVARSILVKVACARGAEPEDRTMALSIWAEAQQLGLLPTETEYPEVMLAVLTDLAIGSRPFSKRKRRKLREQLFGARCLLNSIAQFRAEATPATGKPAAEVLLS